MLNFSILSFIILLSLVSATHTEVNVDIGYNSELSSSRTDDYSNYHQAENAERWLQQFFYQPVPSVSSSESDEAIVPVTESLIRIPFISCGSESDIASDVEVFSSVWPPVADTVARIEIKGKLSSEITKGKWK